MKLGATLYIKNTPEAVKFYMEAFGMTLGYNEKFPDHTYMHAELQRDGQTVFAVSEHKNDDLVADMHKSASEKLMPTTSLGIGFVTEDEVKKAYEMLRQEGTVLRPIGELPWSKCSADVLDRYGVCWYLYL